MWIYQKKLQYPVRVSGPDVKMAKFLHTQYGGPDGELSAALRYLNQRYTMPTKIARGLLTDIGTEELAHLEIIATMIYKLLQGVPVDVLRREGYGDFYSIHGPALFLQDPNGVPWTASYIQAQGDPVSDLHEDLAAEQKARQAYEQLLHLTDDPLLKDGIRFLREREIIHYQRFGEALNNVQGFMNTKKYY
jgi:spore coat protein JC